MSGYNILSWWLIHFFACGFIRPFGCATERGGRKERMVRSSTCWCFFDSYLLLSNGFLGPFAGGTSKNGMD